MHARPAPRLLACLLAGLLGLPSPAVWAGPADDLRDLVGARGAGGETELENRGYTHVDTSKTPSAAYAYWWSNAKRACVRVTTRDGRYQALVDTDASDCGQTKKESGMSDGAKVAIGAAALLGIAALIHKSHDRDDRRLNERQTADFERGYRDGLYNSSFHNYDNSREYNDGYNKGVQERGQQTNYRNGSAHRGGYQPYTSVSDLQGRDSAWAFGQLESRGFQLAGERSLHHGRYQFFYWNDRHGQCVDLHTRDSRVESVSETNRYACNR